MPSSYPTTSRRPTSKPSILPSDVPSLSPTTSTNPSSSPSDGCYEPINYVCEIVDPGTSGLPQNIVLGCANPDICDVLECQSTIPPSEACCHCEGRENRALPPPSESPSQDPTTF